MASQRCRLLELPTEIRLDIYEYLVKPACIVLISSARETFASIPNDVIATTRWCKEPPGDWYRVESSGEWYKERTGDEVYLGILCTCRAIWEEATPLLTKPSSLFLSPSESAYAVPCDKQIVDVSWLPGVRQISSLSIQLATLQYTFAEDSTHHRWLADYLEKDLRLMSLELVLEDCPCLTSEEEENHDDDEHTTLDHLQSLIGVWS